MRQSELFWEINFLSTWEYHPWTTVDLCDCAKAEVRGNELIFARELIQAFQDWVIVSNWCLKIEATF